MDQELARRRPVMLKSVRNGVGIGLRPDGTHCRLNIYWWPGRESILNKLPIFKVQAQARVRSNKSREGEEEGTSHERRVQLTVQ